jgi:hypothetical protein
MRKIGLIFLITISLGLFLSTFKVEAQEIRGSHEIDPKIKTEVFKVLDDYMLSFNSRDKKAHFATYHFPHYRLASGKMTVLEKPDLSDSTKFLEKMVQAGWLHSAWEHRNIIQASDSKVHVDTKFIRYSANGSILGTYESLYIVTKENGRWGIKMRSSFAD